MKSKYLLICILLIAILLRLWKIGSVPISLHGDEVGVGYNALSLIRDGIDEYGKPWPLVFRADVPPIIFYATIPSIVAFGSTNIAVRFPSVIAGIITLLLFNKLIRSLFETDVIHKNKITSTTFFATFIFALSPVFVQLSRIAHDGNYALLFQFVGILVFLRFLRNKHIYWWYLCVLTMGLAAYSYHAPRLTAVLILLGWGWWARKLLTRRNVILSILLFLIVVSPILFDIAHKPVSATRIGGINIFIGEKLTLTSVAMLPIKLGINYILQYDFTQLFLDTQSSRYFNVYQVGLLYITLLPLLLYGIFFVWKKSKYRFLLFWWLLISVAPGALTQGPANTGRNIFFFPVFIILIAYGFMFLISKRMVKKSFITLLAICLFSINVGWFLHQYFVDSPQRFQSQWQYGQDRLAREAIKLESTADKVIISDSFKQAYVYVLFYGNRSIHEILDSPNVARHPFIGYNAFGKYEFRPINWEEDKLLRNTVLIGSANDFQIDEISKHDFIFLSKENFQIVHTKK